MTMEQREALYRRKGVRALMVEEKDTEDPEEEEEEAQRVPDTTTPTYSLLDE